jgi:4-diphosphocytidyl-2C-methyl-D-erythritol kinase
VTGRQSERAIHELTGIITSIDKVDDLEISGMTSKEIA